MIGVDFYGAFLSKHRGSIGPSEQISKALENLFRIKRISEINNPWARSFHSLFNALTSRAEIAVLDVYSTRIIWQTYLLSFILNLRKKQIISVVHGGGLAENFKNIEKPILGILTRSQTILSPSKYLADFYLSKGFQVEFLPNPVDTSMFQRVTITNVESTTVLWVRAFGEIYDPTLAVDVFYHLKKYLPDSRMIMVGPDKGLLAETKRHAGELDLANQIEFTGPLQHSKLNKYFQRASIFLNTTKFESFGLALYEAAATGVPIVSTSVGEIKYSWKHESDAMLHEERNPEKMAMSILEIEKRPELKNQLIETAFQRVDSCAPHKIYKRWEEMLKGSQTF